MKNHRVSIIGLVLITVFLVFGIPEKGETESGVERYYSTAGQDESKSEKIRRLKLKICEKDLDTLYKIYGKGEKLLQTIDRLKGKAAYDPVYAGVVGLLDETVYDTLIFLRTVEDQIDTTEEICRHIATGRHKSDLYYPEGGPEKSKSEIIRGLKVLLCGPDFNKLERTYNHTRKLIETIETLMGKIPVYSIYANDHSELEAAVNGTRIFFSSISDQILATKKICACIASGCSKSELIRDTDAGIESDLPSPNLLLLVIWELYD